jgi:AraC-like DNA-binding protein
VGHPIFELASMFNSFVGYSELDHSVIRKFQGFDFETGSSFWHKSLAAYLGTNNQRKIKEVENKARIIGYTRLIRRSIRRKGLESETGRAEIALWTEELLALLAQTDTPIGAIASLSGFGSDIALSKLFHRRFGTSLLAWRKANIGGCWANYDEEMFLKWFEGRD